MPSPAKLSPPAENLLLAALPVKEYRRLLPQLERVAMPFAEILYEPGDVIRHVYFPNDSIVSLLSVVAERSTLEVGLVGNEGMAGVPAFLGVGASPNRALVQGAGTAMRMRAGALRTESERAGPLRRLLHLYTHSLLIQVSQTAACNRFHLAEERLARWLLMTHDRLRSDEFPLTQEFMSNMLGVRREGVSKAATALQRDELISYSRGHIRVLDRAGLEAAACECYRVIRQDSDGHRASSRV